MFLGGGVRECAGGGTNLALPGNRLKDSVCLFLSHNYDIYKQL